MNNLSNDMEVQTGAAGAPLLVSGQDPVPESTAWEDAPKPNPSISDFKLMDSNALYVDKSLVIKDIIDAYPTAGIFLFTRPRRFGKTFLMTTLKVFFEKPGTRKDLGSTEDTARFFHDKKIWACSEKYRTHQGKYPVVYLSFGEVKASSWEDTYVLFVDRLITEVSMHPEILNSSLRDVWILFWGSQAVDKRLMVWGSLKGSCFPSSRIKTMYGRSLGSTSQYLAQ